jgi:putative oxidoreductase
VDLTSFALLILRLGIGLTFAAHGAQKVFGWWGGPGLAGWEGAMERMRYRPARPFAVISALVELIGGLLLAVGLVTPIAAAALVAQSVVIIGQVHWEHGFFSASSGMEFPLVLGIGAAAIGLAGPGAYSLDAAAGVSADPTARIVLIVAGLVIGLLVLTIPRVGSSESATRV